MKFEIHFTINGVDDFFIIEGDTMDLILEKVKYEVEKRGLSEEKNSLWSRKV